MKLREIYAASMPYVARPQCDRPAQVGRASEPATREIYGSVVPFVARPLPPVKVEPVRIAPQPEPGEVEKIVSAWSEILGMQLKPEKVRRHLETLRRWQGRLESKGEGLL